MAVKPKIRPTSGRQPPSPPYRFGEPEKRNWLGLVLFWVFVIGAIAASVWMLNRSPRLHPLECDTSNGMGSLTSFGSCHEQE